MTMEKSFCQMFAAVFVLGFLAFAPAPAAAQTASSTFANAGMAAYVKLDSISQTTFDKACGSLFGSAETASSTYMIGVKQYGSMNFHIYLGADGWLVVYLLKTEAPSRIVNWDADAGLSDTLLKTAAKDAIERIGANANALATLKYYDFGNPQATKMTLVKESIPPNGPSMSNDFSILIPGTLYQASWVVSANSSCGMGTWGYPIGLRVDGNYVAGAGCSSLTYGNYDADLFNDHVSHKVQFDKVYWDVSASEATVFLYSVN